MTFSSAIRLRHVGKTYANGTVALDDVNLAIAPTEFVSLVGPSGCGKSTVLRLMAGLSPLSNGTVEWGDALSRDRLSFVFQDASLMPWATVQDNVRLPLRLAGVPKAKAEAAIANALKMVDLQGYERAYPRQLSGGMKMRVSIARSLVTQPSLMLMDEPFGALDEMTRSRLNSDILHLWETQRWTVVFVTHNIYEAVYLSQRVVVMAAQPGRIVADIAIDAPYPRNDAFRTSPLFNNYCRDVAQQLAEASLGMPPLADLRQP
ncbi:MAG: ABC transporter ATP-binding protein [Elainellaceae cyanobacterium]